ncbi:MAG: DUF4870 domain-containing protein [Candidatus Andersenbacteria bacterium]
MDQLSTPPDNNQPAAPLGGAGGSKLSGGQNERLLAAISYLWVVSLIMLLLKRDSDFIQFHAKQGLVIFIASIILGFIPLIGWLLNLVLFVFVIMGFVAALQGQRRKLPLVATVAEMIKF